MSETTKKKKSSKSPTERALATLKKEGYTFGIVERFNAFAGPPGMKCPACFKNRIGKRQDFLGFADIIYCTPTSIVALQVTANNGGNHAARKAKIISEPRALAWIRAGGLIEIWSYALQGAKGEAKRWKCRKEEIVASDFQ